MKLIPETPKGTEKIAIVFNYTEHKDLTKYLKDMKLHKINNKEILWVSLFDNKTTKPPLADIRKAVIDLEDMLKSLAINVVVDMTTSFDVKQKKMTKGLLFKGIFKRDNNLWQHRGVLETSLGDWEGKFIQGLRWESIVREKDYKDVIESEFRVKPNKVNIEIPKTEQEIINAVKVLLQADYLAFDTEASGLKPFAKNFLLYTLQWTSNKDKDTSYIFMYEHPKKHVSKSIKELIAKGTKTLLYRKKVWVHNMSYDALVMKAKFDIDFYKTDLYDSMIIYHFLTNTYKTVPLGLKDICFKHGVLFDWDSDLDNFKKAYCAEHKMKKEDFKYEYFELNDLILYAGYDTVALMYFIDVLEDMSKNHIALDVIRETYEKHWKSIMQTLCEAMYQGLPFSMQEAVKLRDKNETRIKAISELIEVNPFIKNTEQKLINIAYEKALIEYNKKVQNAESKGKVFKGKEPDLNNGKYGSINFDIKFKTTSTAHKKVLFIDVLKMKVLEKTDTGSPKLSDDIIAKYSEERPDIDILTLFSEKAKLEKTLTTYIYPWIELVKNDRDGRLRSTFNPLNTSGRLRGSSPNLLNITKGRGLKEVIQSDYKNGWVLGQIDVNSLEERASLLAHKDPTKLAMKESGVEDMHSASAISISKAKGDGILTSLDASNPEHLKKVKKEFANLRQDGKALTFGIQFLCSWRSIAFTYGVTENIAKDILNSHWNTFHGEKAFIDKKVKEFAENGYDIYHGNVPILTPDMTTDMDDKDNMNNIRTVYNGVHQSSSFVVLRAMDKANRKFREENITCKLFLSVYDSIIYEGHIDSIAYASDVMYEFMCEPFMENQLFPLAHEVEIGIDYSAEFVLSQDKDEQQEQINEFKKKHNIK